jgi:hypothetical protein
MYGLDGPKVDGGGIERMLRTRERYEEESERVCLLCVFCISSKAVLLAEVLSRVRNAELLMRLSNQS